ncbi:MAG: hypothetical protein PHY28_09900 [Dehalococcoidales bacterium]|jgi:hypothetical protein|nr:hypothetical protein [Dehalococcoidales bacterium]
MTAQVVTITESNNAQSALKKIVWDWACTDGGIVTGSVTTSKYTGQVVRLITNPDASTDNPTDNYTVQVLDSDSADVLMGSGASRDTADTEQVLASSLGYVYDSTLTLEITAAGDAKKGLVILYILQQ